MNNIKRFPFLALNPKLGQSSSMPVLPLTLFLGNQSVQDQGLLDTGAALNVLPYSVGLALGAVWEEAGPLVHLTGNLARFEARGIAIQAKIDGFDPIEFIFAWTRAETSRLILGQFNFFMNFDIFFSRSQHYFEVMPKGSQNNEMKMITKPD